MEGGWVDDRAQNEMVAGVAFDTGTLSGASDVTLVRNVTLGI